MEPAMQCVTRTRIATAKTQTWTVALSKVSGRRLPALSEGRLSLTQRKANKNVPTPKLCSSAQERNYSREDHVADERFHSWHRNDLENTLVPIRKATKIPSVKIAREARLETHLLQNERESVPSLECHSFHRQRQTLPFYTCRRHNIAGGIHRLAFFSSDYIRWDAL